MPLVNQRSCSPGSLSHTPSPQNLTLACRPPDVQLGGLFPRRRSPAADEAPANPLHVQGRSGTGSPSAAPPQAVYPPTGLQFQFPESAGGVRAAQIMVDCRRVGPTKNVHVWRPRPLLGDSLHAPDLGVRCLAHFFVLTSIWFKLQSLTAALSRTGACIIVRVCVSSPPPWRRIRLRFLEPGFPGGLVFLTTGN